MNASAGERPLVSVVIPVYNQAEYVRGAIDSVLAQDYAPLELVVVNDGSTDETADVLAAYQGSINVLHQENRGAAAALNEGIRRSQGQLVCWLSADDIFLPGKIRAQVEAFGTEPSLGLVYTGYERIRADGSRIETVAAPEAVHPDPYLTVFWRNSINGSSVMVPRGVFDECGQFDERLRADVDADMWLRVTQRYPIRCLAGVYLGYRIHGNTLSANERLMSDSMTEVRRRRLRSGELRERLAAFERRPARLTSRMAEDFAAQGMFSLADDMLSLSRDFGRDPAQLRARIAIALIAIARRSRIGARITWPLRRGLAVLRAAQTRRS